jgi:rare lipoprotein A
LTNITTTILNVGRSFIATATSATTFKDLFRVIFADSAMAKAGLMALNVAIKAFSTLALLALSQSDFSDPLNTSINEAKLNIKNGIADIRYALASLRGDAEQTGKVLASINVASKGLELNPAKIIGLSGESFKSDDLITKVNNASDAIKELLNNWEKLNSYAYTALTGQKIPDWMNPLGALKTKPEQIKEAQSLGLGDIVTEKDTYLTLGKQQLLNSARDLKSLNEGLSLALDELNLSAEKRGEFINGKLAATVRNLQAYDTQLLQLSRRRKELSLNGDSASKVQIREIDKQIVDINKKRALEAKPLETITSTVKDFVKIIEAKQQEIQNISDIKSRNALKALVEPTVKVIKETEQFLSSSRVGQLIQPLEEVWSRVSTRIGDAEQRSQQLQRTAKIFNLRSQAQLANRVSSQSTDSQIKADADSLSLQTLKRTESQLAFILDERAKALDRLLEVGGNDINSSRKEETDKIKEQINAGLESLEDTRLQIANSRQRLILSFRDTNKQIDEYYKQVLKDTESLNNDIKSTQNTIALGTQKNRLKEALLGFQDTFATQFVDGLVSMLDTLNQPMQQYLQSVNTITNTKNGLEKQLEESRKTVEQINNIRNQNSSIQKPVEQYTNVPTRMSANFTQAYSSVGVQSPITGRAPITSGYGMRIHPTTGKHKMHPAIDYGVPTGTPVLSPTAGRVSRVFNDRGGGLTVTVKSIDTAGRVLEQSFLHLSESLVKIGQQVRQGQVIAKSGNSGVYTTGAHLDYRVKVNGQFVNPLDFFKEKVTIGGQGGATDDGIPASAKRIQKKPASNNAPWVKTIASMYGNGDGFHGKPTASGETFNKNAMTAASTSLPLGSYVEVRNPATGQTAIVKINDRGPYDPSSVGRGQRLRPHPTRGLDLSVAAANSIGITENQGLGKVEYRQVTANAKPSPNTNNTIRATRNNNVIDETMRTVSQSTPVQSIASEQEFRVTVEKIGEANKQINENFNRTIKNADNLLRANEKTTDIDLRIQQQRNNRILEQGLKEGADALKTERRATEDVLLNPTSNTWIDRYTREQLTIERKYEDTGKRTEDALKKTLSARDQLLELLDNIRSDRGLQTNPYIKQQVIEAEKAIQQLTIQADEYRILIAQQEDLKKVELSRIDETFRAEIEKQAGIDRARMQTAKIAELNVKADLAQANQSNKFDFSFGDPLVIRNEAKKLEIQQQFDESLAQFNEFAKTSNMGLMEWIKLRQTLSRTNQVTEIVNESDFQKQVRDRELERQKLEFDKQNRGVTSRGNLLGAMSESLNNQGLGVFAREYDKQRQILEQNQAYKQALLDLNEYAITNGLAADEVKQLTTELDHLNT